MVASLSFCRRISPRTILPLALLVGLAFLASAPAYAQTTPLFVVDRDTAQLLTIDPLTGQTLSSVPITLGGFTVENATSLARHPQTGQVFAILKIQGQAGRELVTLDTATGVATSIGNTGDAFADITFDDTGTLWGVTGNAPQAVTPETLFTIDTTTGAPTMIVALGNGDFGEALAFNPNDGLLYHMSGTATRILETIDPANPMNAPVNIPITGDLADEVTGMVHWAGDMFLVVSRDFSLYIVRANGQSRLQSPPLAFQAKGPLFTPAGACNVARMYGTAHRGQDGPSLLYVIDPATGASTLVGPTGFERVNGLDFLPDNRLFGFGETMDGANTTTTIEIDPCTGVGATVGAFGLAGQPIELATRPADGVLFALFDGVALATVNTGTGAGTAVGALTPINCCGFGMAYGAAGSLFTITGDTNSTIQLHTVDDTTGMTTVVAAVTVPAPQSTEDARINGLAFDGLAGTMFGALVDGGASFATGPFDWLVTLDTATGNVTAVGPTQTGLNAIAINGNVADIAIDKTDIPDPVLEGDNIEYTITVTNNGPGDALDVTCEDVLPANVMFAGFVSISQGAAVFNGVDTVSCFFGTIANGAFATLTFEVSTDATSVPLVSNTVTTATTSADPNLVNNTDTEDTVVTPLLADIAIDKTDSPDPVLEGGNITYTLTVTNAGPNDALNVTCTDVLPGNVTFASFVTISQGVGIFNGVDTVTCVFGTIPSGGNAFLVFQVSTSGASVPLVSNTATTATDTMDPVMANNSDTETTVVAGLADLAVTKTDTPDPARLSNPLTYTVLVSNAGPSGALNVVLTDTLPGGVTFNSATSTQGTCMQAMGVVTCAIGNMAAMATATVTITVTPTAVGMISNTAVVTSTNDPNAANDTDMETTEVVDFTIAAMPASVAVVRGNSGVYTITLTPVGTTFPFAITLSASGQPAFTTVIFQTNPVTPNAAPANSNLVIQTTAPVFAENRAPGGSPLLAFGLGLPLFFFGAVVLGSPGRRKPWRAALALALLLVVLLLNFGCASGELPAGTTGTPVGTFPITITGTSGTLTHSTTVDLVVQ